MPRQAVEEHAGQPHGVDHAALGDRRVDVDAADRHDGQVGGERLAVDLARAAAVERVADHGAEFLQIDVIDAVADLLVAGEADADRAVRHFRTGQQLRGRLHDDGDAAPCRRRRAASCRRW